MRAWDGLLGAGTVLMILVLSLGLHGATAGAGDPPDPPDPPDRPQPTPSPSPSPARGTVEVIALPDRPDTAAARDLAETLARRHGLTVVALYPLTALPAVLARFLLRDGGDPSVRAARLAAEAGVLEADVDATYETQDDPHAPRQYALRLIGADQAHAALRGRGVVVAVVDAGIDSGHEDLQGAVTAAESLVGDGPPSPDMHGTAVAGLIGARRDNGRGIVGVAPEATLIALQACVPKQADRAAVLNLSVGGPPNRVIGRLVEAALARGVAVVAAAGNNGPFGPPLHPAALPGVIAVGATDAQDQPYVRTNLGAHVTLMAPGVDVMTTLPPHRYAFVTGTSYAAAHVSGVVALLREANPRATPPQVRDALRGAALVSGAGAAGRIDLCRTLAALGRADLCRATAGS